MVQKALLESCLLDNLQVVPTPRNTCADFRSHPCGGGCGPFALGRAATHRPPHPHEAGYDLHAGFNRVSQTASAGARQRGEAAATTRSRFPWRDTRRSSWPSRWRRTAGDPRGGRQAAGRSALPVLRYRFGPSRTFRSWESTATGTSPVQREGRQRNRRPRKRRRRHGRERGLWRQATVQASPTIWPRWRHQSKLNLQRGP